MMLMANRRNELGIRNFEANLRSTSWAKNKRIYFSFLSNRCVFYSFCHWLSKKFLKRYFVRDFISRKFQFTLVFFGLL